MSFAKPLKEIAKHLYDLSDEQVNGNSKETVDPRYGVTPRFILQVLGTDACRKIYPNTWIDYWAREYKKNYDPTEVVIVTDVRFKNELEVIKTNGGVVWKLVRLDGPGAQGGVIGHASEAEQKGIPDNDFDAVIKAKSGDLNGLIANAIEEYQRLAILLTDPIDR